MGFMPSKEHFETERNYVDQWSPAFSHQGLVSWKTVFPLLGVVGGVGGTVQAVMPAMGSSR